MTGASAERLRQHVEALEGPRHRRTAPAALRRAAGYIGQVLAGTGLPVEERPVRFHGQDYPNLVARLAGTTPDRPRVLIGAHYDTAAGTPGADDNASGVAALLEAARILAGDQPAVTVEFVAFTLEEFQGTRYGIGSRAFAEAARRAGERYGGALILEMVGYTDGRDRSQLVPPALWRRGFSRRGTFLAAAGDDRSGALLDALTATAQATVPDLPVATLTVPFRGWLHPYTRLSDNRSFWDAGYPALMLTDTAFLRNPHYHRKSDRADTLDYQFMSRVTDLVAATVRRLAS